LLDGFYLNNQANVLGEAPVNAVVHAELGAVDGGFEIAAAHFTLDHGVVIAVELVSLEGHGVGLAQQGQVAADLAHFVAVEGELVTGELDGGVLGCVKQVGALQVLVERVKTGVDGSCVDGDFNLAGLGGLVQLSGAFFLSKRPRLVEVPKWPISNVT